MADSSYLQWTEHLGAKSVSVIYLEYDYIYIIISGTLSPEVTIESTKIRDSVKKEEDTGCRNHGIQHSTKFQDNRSSVCLTNSQGRLTTENSTLRRNVSRRPKKR